MYLRPALILVIWSAIWPLAAPVRGDVLVLANRTSDTIDIELAFGPDARSSDSIRSLDVLSVRATGEAVVEFGPENERRQFELSTDAAYFFFRRNAQAGGDAGLEIEQIGLAPAEAESAGAPAAADLSPKDTQTDRTGDGNWPKHVVPVKVFVDDQGPTAPSRRELQLRNRVAAASRIFEHHCGVSFDVVACTFWNPGNEEISYEDLCREFESRVKTDPGTLAIGFTSRYPLPVSRTKLAGMGQALSPYIMLQEWSEPTEAERLELLVHALGHYLGAGHSPESDSVMRPLLGDRQAIARRFRIGFDPLNTLAISLVAQELRAHDMANLDDMDPKARPLLNQVYATLAGSPGSRTAGCHVDFSPRTGTPASVRPAGENPSSAPAAGTTSNQPQLNSRPGLSTNATASGRGAAGAAGSVASAAPRVQSAVAAPANERFADGQTKETPDFRRHVLPLLGRLGCNGRACHGSFQGRGGFRLSLFGYDFLADYQALAGGNEPRVDKANPAASLILTKPTLQEDHDGGQHFEAGDWRYRLLLKWIEGGAVGLNSGPGDLVSLSVEPREIVLSRVGQQVPLAAVATWSDGYREDVTQLCRFRTSDETVATVNEEGVITAAGPGDTYIVSFYDNGVAPVQVMLPSSDLVGDRFPEVAPPTRVDELVFAKLRKLGIVPSPLSTDEEFLRRASLDISGTLPTPDQILNFVADPSADKRARKIEELLDSPGYAAWWTTKLCDFTGNSERNTADQGFRPQQAGQWYEWIHRRVRENVPYDQIVAGIVLATGREERQDFDTYSAQTTAYFRSQNPADFSLRPTMPHYWSSRRFNEPKEMALGFAWSFLGVRLQCAECHKHPFDVWTKQDFEQFTAFFQPVRYGFAPDAHQRHKEMESELGLNRRGNEAFKRRAVLAAAGTTIPWREVYIARGAEAKRLPGMKPPKGKGKRPAGRVLTPKLLGDEQVLASRYYDPREPLMEWVRGPDHPYFAAAIVNRVWANYFGLGIIDPPDDISLANPPSNPELMEYLERGFVASGYDMKWLHRQIALSRTYQSSWRPSDTNRLDTHNFSRALLRRMPAEVAYDAIVHATASDAEMRNLELDMSERAIGVLSSSAGPKLGGNYVLPLFGKPARAIGCDCERSSETSLLQTIFLRNDEALFALVDRHGGWLRQIAGKDYRRSPQTAATDQKPANANPVNGKAVDRPAELATAGAGSASLVTTRRIAISAGANRQSQQTELIRQAYLRTVCRLPTDDEIAKAKAHLGTSPDFTMGMRDLIWALLNTKEFIVNR